MMELPRPISPASSSASSLDSNGLPVGRIKCSKEKILVGDRHYRSATEALLAYLKQFETISAVVDKNRDSLLPNKVLSSRGSQTNGTSDGETTPGSNLSTDLNGIGVDNKKDEVEQLLTSKVSPELKEEVTDTLREIKLKNLLKKAVSKSQKPGKTGLQQEVEAALARSAQLLEKVTMEDIQSTKAGLSDISDISLPTQLLLAEAEGSSNNSNDSILSQDLDDFKGKRNGHVYSYHTDYLQRSNLSPPDSLHNPHNLRQTRLKQRHLSQDDLTLNNQFSPSLHNNKLLSSSASSNSSSKISDICENLRRIRSRSVPPGSIRNRTPHLLDELNQPGSKPVPSWVNESDSNTSIVSDENSKPVIPQWVEDVAKSDITIDHIISEHNKRKQATLSKRKPLSNHNSFSKSEGDLSNWKELLKLDTSLPSSPISNLLQPLEKHVTFTDSLSSIPRALRQPTHSTPLRNHNRLKTKYEVMVNGSHTMSPVRNVTKTIDNADISDVESDLKSSSLDTLALLTGRPHTRHKGSQILNGNSLAPKIFLESPILSSIEQDRTILSPSPTNSTNGVVSSSDGLDGDRSWEKQTGTFKPPVPVGSSDQHRGKSNDTNENSKKNSSSSLTGGNQPGSMETLKNMLFKLQKEESSVNASNSNAESGEQLTQNPPSLPALQDYDFQTEPGGHSLEKALHHLDRLKTLVKNTTTSDHVDIVNGHGEKET